ncbi:MAG TPA: enoyl-CoA hydratase-related protein [Acidimicrobiales bacterium]|nr:enoyl-CoA hydratase-related protein [Acidimicrobiales bacterium]
MSDVAPFQPPVLLTEVVDQVGVVTMNRPERRNALNGELVAALDTAVKQMAADPAVKVVVLTGAAPDGGHGGFCSGGDVKGSGGPGMELGVPPKALEGDLARHDSHAAMLLHLMPKPTIAMVGGPAVGAGLSLAAACDLRYASDDAVFSAGFAPNGLSGDYGGTVFWTRILGTAVTRELYLLNDRLSAAEALAKGMVHAVVPAAGLRDHTMAIAQRLVRMSGAVLARVKDNLNQAEDDADRRRYLFANETENQIAVSMERIARAQKGSGTEA